MMKYAVCIIAHDKPELLKRLVNRLSCDHTEIFIHLDAECRLEDYSEIKNAAFIEKRVRVHWGGRSMIKAMLNLIDDVLKHSSCEYLLFISGQDYPLADPKDYDSLLDTTKNYVQYELLPRNRWYKGGFERVSYFYPFCSPESLLSRATVKFQKLLHITRKYRKQDFSLYGGSQWINIRLEAARYILANWRRYYRFFRFTLIPDEMFFQTLLLNSPLKDTIINNNLRFIVYKGDQPHPVSLGTVDIRQMMDSLSLFARKIEDETTFLRLEAAREE